MKRIESAVVFAGLIVLALGLVASASKRHHKRLGGDRVIHRGNGVRSLCVQGDRLACVCLDEELLSWR